ncbi:GroES-like protein [Punctularia strigosozonata HHB-11173 SS5]|uniref:GroES-like protein n=1 Tax=Punctularia strigosozonata (strain HHB-11173) TaxID=741275 RepID=UPI0004417DC6|nr:GroES-like protein [Punctularia strigosozonata HHB-11173 SS5]EIN09610.1 GroES-like protein [Punctularia strigosozonata HHB-11173 SS5]
MSTMLAAVYTPGNDQLNLVPDFPIPEPATNEVLLKIKACGVCHSDVFVLTDATDTRTYVMGHEAAGEAVKLGSSVASEKIKLGQLYAIWVRFTGCVPPPVGTPPDAVPAFGLGINGAYADYAVVPASQLVPVPDGVPPEIAAVCADAVITPYHAVHTTANIQPGQTVLIFGIGGLGLNAVQIAKHFGAKVFAVDIRPESRALAKEFGADEAFSTIELANELAKGFFVDTVIDFVASENSFDQGIQATSATFGQTLGAKSGTIVLVGISRDDQKVSSVDLVTGHVSVIPSLYGTIDDLKEVLDLVSQGVIKPQVQTAPLKEVNKVLHELRAENSDSPEA